jgi:hypothetical protein
MKTKNPKAALNKRVTIYLTADSESIQSYFNPHDPSPIYSRHLSDEFETYLERSIREVKRYSILNYKITCKSKIDRLFTDPLLQAVRKHFEIKKRIKQAEFRKFKKKSYILLAISITVAVILHGLLPMIVHEGNGLYKVMSNFFDLFSWVMMWKPVERLVFYWNPFLKEIDIYEKLICAEAIVLYNEEEEELSNVYPLTKVQ